MENRVEIVGKDQGSEREAANVIGRLLEPRLTDGCRLLIVVGARCLGEPVQDIDLLLLGTFGRGLTFKGQSPDTVGQSVRLVNLALIIEVKDHSGDSLKFSGQHVKVWYRDKGWEDATDQVLRQRVALCKYLERRELPVPWIGTLIWLPHHAEPIPQAASDVLGAKVGIDDFFAAVERVRPPKRDDEGFHIAFKRNIDIGAIQQAQGFFSEKIEPTKGDRRRLEVICDRLMKDQKYVERLGTQLLVFRGRGGSGKTVHLLRLAHDLYQAGKRVLFLTYNKALVADIRRLLVIKDISDAAFDRAVRISTAHSFFIGMMRAWGYWQDQPKGHEFDEDLYDSSKSKLVQLMHGETPESLMQGSSLSEDAPEVFGWDYVLVDEAQDWPEDEKEILFTTFGHKRCVIADGVDQFIRRDLPCDWTPPDRNRQVVPLRRALRMKSCLCRFVTAFAMEAGVGWDQEINDEIRGGEITIINGPYTREWHERILKRHLDDGNQPVDALFCVPPAHKTQAPGFAHTLRVWGYSVWDGTSREVRETFPTKPDEHRIVKYQSCRGLEGWTVVCLALDKFYEDRFEDGLKTQGSLLEAPEEHARRRAAHWTLIPLTRAIDHLVIQLSESSGALYTICGELARRFPDFITWAK